MIALCRDGLIIIYQMIHVELSMQVMAAGAVLIIDQTIGVMTLPGANTTVLWGCQVHGAFRPILQWGGKTQTPQTAPSVTMNASLGVNKQSVSNTIPTLEAHALTSLPVWAIRPGLSLRFEHRPTQWSTGKGQIQEEESFKVNHSSWVVLMYGSTERKQRDSTYIYKTGNVKNYCMRGKSILREPLISSNETEN